MLVLMTLRALILLQLLAALCWPAQASTAVDAPHRSMHTLLAQHQHLESTAHHHEHQSAPDKADDHDHEAQLQLGLADESMLLSGVPNELSADHHHHFEASPSAALLAAHALPAMISQAVQNPRALAAMYSAEPQPKLRPPII